jgi:hypothetical protein
LRVVILGVRRDDIDVKKGIGSWQPIPCAEIAIDENTDRTLPDHAFLGGNL